MTTPIPDQDQLRVFAKKIAFLLLLVLLWYIRDIVVLLLISGVLAAGIAPAVARLRVLVRHHFHRRIRRSTAVLMVYLPFLICATLVLFFGLPFLLEQSRKLFTELPRLLDERFFTPLEKYMSVEHLRAIVRQPVDDSAPLVTWVRGAATIIASAFAALFIIFYMLIDAERLKNLFLLAFPSRERAAKKVLVRRLGRRMSAWLSAQLLLALVIAGATFVALLALRIPYALPLALLAGLGEMIPVVGPILGAIPALIVALFQSPWQFWAMLAAAIIIQQVENFILVPRLMGNQLHVSPLGIFIAFLIGTSLLGIIGAVLAAPMAAAAQLIIDEVYVGRRERRQDTSRPGAIATTDAIEEEERQKERATEAARAGDEENPTNA